MKCARLLLITVWLSIKVFFDIMEKNSPVYRKETRPRFQKSLREIPETYRKKGGEIMETFDPEKKPKLKKVSGLLKKSGVAAVLVIAIP